MADLTLLQAAARRLGELGADAACLHQTYKVTCCYASFSQSRSILKTTDSTELSAVVQLGSRQGKVSRVCAGEADAAALAEAAYSAAQEAAEGMSLPLQSIEPQEHIRGCLTPDPEMMQQRYTDFLRDTAEAYPSICIRVGNLAHIREEHTFLDLGGNCASDTFGYYSFGASYSAVGKERSTAFMGNDLRMNDLEKPLFSYGSLTEQLELTEKLLLPQADHKPEENVILFPPQSLTMLFYMLTDSQLSDSPMQSKTSRWAKSFGQQVASPSLTMRNAPLSEGILGEPMLNDMGRPVQNSTIIDHGVLVGTALSPRVAQELSLPEGCGDYFCYELEAGETPLSELLSGIRSGLLVGRLSGGRPTVAGEISYVAKGSYLIEDGKITKPCEGVVISGNLIDALQQLDGISAERHCNGSCNLPYLKVSKLKLS